MNLNLINTNRFYPTKFTSSWVLNSPQLRSWGAIRIQENGDALYYGIYDADEKSAIVTLNTNFANLYYSDPERCETALLLQSSKPLAVHNIFAVREWIDELMRGYDDSCEIVGTNDAAYEISIEHMQPTNVPYPYLIESLEPNLVPPGMLYWHDLSMPVQPIVSLNPGMDIQIESELAKNNIESHRVNRSFALRIKDDWDFMWEKMARQFYMIVRGDGDQIRYRRMLFVPEKLYLSLDAAKLNLLSGTDLLLRGVD